MVVLDIQHDGQTGRLEKVIHHFLCVVDSSFPTKGYCVGFILSVFVDS